MSNQEKLTELEGVLSGENFQAKTLVDTIERLGLSDEECKPLFLKYKRILQQAIQELQSSANELRQKADGLRVLAETYEKIHSLRTTGPRAAIELLENKFPKFFSSCYPRKFEVPGQFHAPRHFVLGAFLAMYQASEFKKESGLGSYSVDKVNTNNFGLKVISALVEKTVPTYFVSEGIIAALGNTDLPKDFLLSDMPWPLDAMLFVLPKNVSGPSEDAIAFIAVVRVTQGEYPNDWIHWGSIDSIVESTKGVHSGKDAACILGITEKGRVFQWEHPISESSIYEASETQVSGADISTLANAKLEEDESSFTSQNLPRMAFQFILAMLACPEMIEAGVRIRVASDKGGKKKCELWSPNFFGRSYRKYDEVLGDGDESSGEHRRPHWRRGHFRHQRVGQGRTGIRVLWIRPVLIGKNHLAAA